MRAERVDDGRDAAEDVVVAALALRLDADAVDRVEMLVDDDPLDLRAAEVDPERVRRHPGPLATPRAPGREHERRSPCRTPRAARSTTPTRT
jgi:hypothetical protein